MSARLQPASVIFTTLSYVVAASSPEATKSLFVLTMLGIPVFGTPVAVAIATAALIASWLRATALLDRREHPRNGRRRARVGASSAALDRGVRSPLVTTRRANQ